MNALAEKWLTALEKNEYAQGNGQLMQQEYRHYRTFCCLGVACDQSPNVELVDADEGLYRHLRTEKEAYALMPAGLADDLGIRRELLTTPDASQTDVKLPLSDDDLAELVDDFPDLDSAEGITLAALNDSGVPFVGIGRLLRKYADKVFA